MKEYELKDTKIIFEFFSKCSIKTDGKLVDEDKEHFSDWSTNFYTKFVLGWIDNKFGVKSREIFPFPEKNMRDYKPLITKKQNDK